MVQYSVKQDGDGFIAEVVGNDSLYAFGYSRDEALKELLNVIDMTIDYHSEFIKKGKYIKNKIINENGNNILLTHAI